MAKSGSKLAETSQNRIKYFKFDFILSTWLKLKCFNYIMRVMRKFLEFLRKCQKSDPEIILLNPQGQENFPEKRTQSSLSHTSKMNEPVWHGAGWTVDHGVVVRIRGWNICSCRKSVTEIGRLETYIGNKIIGLQDY